MGKKRVSPPSQLQEKENKKRKKSNQSTILNESTFNNPIPLYPRRRVY